MRITRLEPGEVFVFGSNAAGMHAAGAAALAHERFGAVWGQGHGLHGHSYAINSMSGLDILHAEVTGFVDFAAEHPELRFLVTEIGCGIAGYTPTEVAPFFAGAGYNVVLPERFAEELGR
ncbi:hypothetical protein BJQ94_13140 [Cryobacterium sp. SO2]|uniref:A1S_2505 family phage non-structural protein n=1 Tax=Cryobacterium sp. SO2 TaxID=1897060 RepID=UPI00223D7C00|nr:hypothetical protein [Cryobacterium sp. SO2]WEO76303.1 hypothetical protein BJQ94_13140 [Cryobacterium sp. SO2]